MADQSNLPNDVKPSIRPDDIPGLREQENSPGSKPADKENDARKGLFNKNGDSPQGQSASSASLASAESAMVNAGNRLAKGFNPASSAELSTAKKIANIFGTKKGKRAAIGGGAGIAIIALIIGGFLVLIPLKIEDIVSTLEDHYSSSTEDAVDQETQNLMSNYITKYVLPSYKSCGTTVDKHCYVGNVLGSDPVSNLYHSWAQARLEQKLAGPPYNIEFRFDSKANTWHIITPDTGDKGLDIGKDGEGLDAVFTSRADVRAAAREAIADETLYKQILLRYKVDRLLSEKYGVKWCTIFCGVTDPLQNNIADQKIAAQLFLTEKVILPRNEALGVAMQCIFSKDCDAADNTEPTTCTEGEDCEIAGAPEDAETDTALRNDLVNLAGKDSDLTADELLEQYKAVKESGFQNYMLDQAVAKIVDIGGGDEAAQEAAQQSVSNALPVIGWANLVAEMISKTGSLGPDMKKMSYMTNVTAAISLWSMYESYADEIHTGHVTSTEVGSFTNSLGPGGESTSNDPELGGTADATQTPLYQSLVNGNDGTSSSSSSTPVSWLNELLPSAYADSTSDSSSTSSTSYLCNNGKPVPKGQLVCSEEVLGGGNSFLNHIHSLLSASGLTELADVWNGSLGAVYNAVTGLAGFIINPLVKATTGVLDAGCSLPTALEGPDALYCKAKSAISTEAPKVMKLAVTQVIPDPISDNMSGGRTFDMMAAGADASNSDYAHTGLGGEELTPTQSTEITNRQESEQQQTFTKLPLFARLFGSNPSSLLSKVALDMPYNLQSAGSSFASFISYPFASLGNSFASIFSNKVSAASTPQADPFGVPQYGYPSGTIPKDPEAYWNANCSDNPSQAYQKTNNWNVAASHTLDQSNGMPANTSENGGTNPCLLIMASTGADGGYLDSSNLTTDDLANVNSSSSTTPVTSGSGTYQSPFHGSCSGFGTTRVDEGVDYYGSCPVYAIGAGVVTLVDRGTSSFWGEYGGNDVVYKLTSGPAAGDSVYVAEYCPPTAGLTAGENVTSSTALCNMQPQSIETGWAMGGTSDAPSASTVYTESNATAYGQNFSELMDSLGVKPTACYDHPGEAFEGTLPSGWPQWVSNPATKAGSNAC